MLLSLLTKDEKIYFIELVRKIILIDGEVSDVEKEIVKKMRLELGNDIEKAKKLNLSFEKLVDFFVGKAKTTQKIVFLNLVSASLQDEWYNVETHMMLQEIQQKFEIQNNEKKELIKIVYAERDLREKAKRIVNE